MQTLDVYDVEMYSKLVFTFYLWGLTHSQLKDVLVRGNWEEGASQTVMWLKENASGLMSWGSN